MLSWPWVGESSRGRAGKRACGPAEKMRVEVGGTNLAELAQAILTGVGEAHMPQFGFSTHAIKEAQRQH